MIDEVVNEGVQRRTVPEVWAKQDGELGWARSLKLCERLYFKNKMRKLNFVF